MLRLLFIVLISQILIYVFYRSLVFISGGKIARRSAFFIFFTLNATILLSLLRLWPGSIVLGAIVLSLLWLWFLKVAFHFFIYVLFLRQGKPCLKIMRLSMPLTLLGLFAYGHHQTYSPQLVHYSIQLHQNIARPFLRKTWRRS